MSAVTPVPVSNPIPHIVISNVVSCGSPEGDAGTSLKIETPTVVQIDQNGEYIGPAHLLAQGDTTFTAVVSSSTDLAGVTEHSTNAAAAVNEQTVQYVSVISSPLDHAYSLTTGTTSAELLRKLNEQRDIIALMEVKMKEMKATIRDLRVTEAKLQEEVRERDRLLSLPGGAFAFVGNVAVRKKMI